jgi:hypothetical protein
MPLSRWWTRLLSCALALALTVTNGPWPEIAWAVVSDAAASRADRASPVDPAQLDVRVLTIPAWKDYRTPFGRERI